MASGPPGRPAAYGQWGPVQISAAGLLVVATVASTGMVYDGLVDERVVREQTVIAEIL
jgi:hypothetical protein